MCLKFLVKHKQQASLPLHCLYNCSIDILPVTFPPKGSLYSLSVPEMTAMTATGIIRPACSTAGARFFFVEKIDKSRRACIDYGGLNEITIKNPLLPPLLICCKVGKSSPNAYHWVQSREEMNGRWLSTILLDTRSI